MFIFLSWVKQQNFLYVERRIGGAGLPGDCDVGDLPQHLMRVTAVMVPLSKDINQ